MVPLVLVEIACYGTRVRDFTYSFICKFVIRRDQTLFRKAFRFQNIEY